MNNKRDFYLGFFLQVLMYYLVIVVGKKLISNNRFAWGTKVDIQKSTSARKIIDDLHNLFKDKAGNDPLAATTFINNIVILITNVIAPQSNPSMLTRLKAIKSAAGSEDGKKVFIEVQKSGNVINTTLKYTDDLDDLGTEEQLAKVLDVKIPMTVAQIDPFVNSAQKQAILPKIKGGVISAKDLLDKLYDIFFKEGGDGDGSKGSSDGDGDGGDVILAIPRDMSGSGHGMGGGFRRGRSNAIDYKKKYLKYKKKLERLQQ